MQKTRISSIRSRIESVGGEVHDPDLRTQKTIIVTVCLFVAPICIIWTLFALALGELANAYTIMLGGSLIMVDLLYLAWRKNYVRFRTTLFIIGLVWLFLLHLSVGGFTGSKSLSWALLIPIAALLSSRPRESYPWFAAYVIIVAVSGFIDPILYPDAMDLNRSLSQFAFSLITVSLIIYLILIYFVDRKNRAYALLEVEQEKSERLLLNVLPKEIAPILKSGQGTIAEDYEHTSTLFADIVGFTRLTAELAPKRLVDLLNEIFSEFDTMVAKYDLEKLRTMGDNYMVVSGAPRRRMDHAQALADLALDMRAYIARRTTFAGEGIGFRIGINSGPIIAGVIGKQKFHYDIWGDAVNVASRMETYGEPGKIQITTATYELIKDAFECEYRGVLEIKGKGSMETWFLEDRRTDNSRSQQ